MAFLGEPYSTFELFRRKMVCKSKILILYHFCPVIKPPVAQVYYMIKPFQQEEIFRKQDSTTKEFILHKRYRFAEFQKVLEDSVMPRGTWIICMSRTNAVSCDIVNGAISSPGAYLELLWYNSVSGFNTHD